MDPEQEAAARRVGSTLCNKWTLERLIGVGGMAAVYVAAHKIGRREAIKILHADVARDPELRMRFEQEAHAVNRFKHPGTVEIRDIDSTEDGAPFLVMELLEGQPLADLARRPGGVALPDLLRWVDELLDVLAAAHAQGIIHRDIKPDNLFVLKDGSLKVLDFGIARVRADSARLRTRVGATLGTAPYMPPEQIRGQEIDARADLFAVGATMFRLIAKRRIHETTNETETLVKMASEPAPSLVTVAPDSPRDVCFVVDRALMFNREQRYPDALTMQRDIRALREGSPPPYAHARLLEGTPAPSALRAPSAAAPIAGPAIIVPPVDMDAPTRAPMSGEEATAVAPPHSVNGAAVAAFLSEPTAAASPVAMQQSVGPSIHGAANGAPPSSALEESLPQASDTPPPVGVMRPPGANTTMRSVGGPVDGARPHGYASPPGALTVAAAPVTVGAPQTQPAGAAPAAPGASIPVVKPPSRYRTLTGQEPNLVLLVLVGVAFAALGVGLTLWLMLRGSGDKTTQGTTPTATAEPDAPDPWPRVQPRPQPRPNNISPQPRPQPAPPPKAEPQPQVPSLPPGATPPQPQPAQPPSKGPPHGKGHGKKD